MRFIKELDPTLTLTPLSDKGYSDRDMASYYSGTFLISELAEEYTVVYVRGTASSKVFECEVLGEEGLENRHIHISKLFRFTPLQGFYDLIGKNGLIEYSLPTVRSYKKGINSELIIIKTKRSDSRGGSISTLRSQIVALNCICSKVQGVFLNGSRVLSRRLAIHDGKLYTTHMNRTVGTYKDGVLHTPFVSIIDRIDQLGVNIKCQLQRL